MCHESSHRSAARVLAAVPPGPPRPLGPRAPLLGRVVAERLPDELVLVDGTSAPAAPQSPLLGVDSSAQMVEALLRDLRVGRKHLPNVYFSLREASKHLPSRPKHLQPAPTVTRARPGGGPLPHSPGTPALGSP